METHRGHWGKAVEDERSSFGALWSGGVPGRGIAGGKSLWHPDALVGRAGREEEAWAEGMEALTCRSGGCSSG